MNREDNQPRYLADIGAKFVHDLENEQAGCQTCDIEIEHRIYFEVLEDAHRQGFRDCEHCIASVGVIKGPRMVRRTG